MKSVFNPDLTKTVKRALPYEFRMQGDGRLAIINTRSQVLVVSHVQVVNILGKDDLDPHRRRMYEAALVEFQKAVKVQ